MNIQNQIQRLKISCPDAFNVEKILLEASRNPLVFRAFENHMHGCKKCYRRVRRIQKFYEILEKEMQKPVSPRVVDFALAIGAANREAVIK